MILIITRHGETEGNVAKLNAGPEDPLTPKGKEQAKQLAERLKHQHLDAIYTSPYPRSLQTAEAIAQFHPKIPFYEIHELREMDHGSYRDKPTDKVDWNIMPADVESRTSLFKRSQHVLAQALKDYPQGSVLFVAHNAVNKALIRVIRNLDPEDRSSMPQSNTNLTIFEISDAGSKEILLNETKHLHVNLTR